MTGNEQGPQDREPATGASQEADMVEELTVPGEDTIDSETAHTELEAARQAARDNLELAQRTQAEMENLRKRTLRDIENAHKFALERFVNELLPVIDSLELGLQASAGTADVNTIREGMELTLKKFADTLVKFGVTAVDPAGEKFTPERHDAVSMVASPDHEAGTVISVLQKGYELNGRLVRPAMVVVSS